MCFLRPNDLETMLEKHVSSRRRIYVFIDKAETKGFEENRKVLEIADSYLSRLELQIKVADRNFGVGGAVPEAINWISAHEERFIVLEDDCHLNDNGFTFMEENINMITGNLSVLCATSPWDLKANTEKLRVNTISKYPLISGWATTSQNWGEISCLIGRKPPVKLLIQTVAKTPKNIFAVAFFLAAHIRVQRKKSKAWDCSMALAMLLLEKKSIVPNITMVTNTGRDNVAAHTIPIGDEDRIFRLESADKPSNFIETSIEFQNLTDKKIEVELYGLKKRHILSPVKSFFV